MNAAGLASRAARQRTTDRSRACRPAFRRDPIPHHQGMQERLGASSAPATMPWPDLLGYGHSPWKNDVSDALGMDTGHSDGSPDLSRNLAMSMDASLVGIMLTATTPKVRTTWRPTCATCSPVLA